MERDIIAKWLESGLKTADITQGDLGDAIGISQDMVSKIINGKRSMSAAEIFRAARFLGRSIPVDKLVGDVRPLELSGEPIFSEPLLLTAPPAMNHEQRFNIPTGEIPQVEGSIGLGHRDDVETITIQMENGETVAAAPVLGTWRIPMSVLQRRVRTSADHLHFLECEGNSMYPLIKDGDVVLVDQSRTNPTMPGIFALWENGGQTIKQIEIVRGTNPVQYRLIPANKDYATYEVPADDVTIIGRYVARFTVD
jgi:SOS-response transcriptional repressor LexA